MTEDDRFKDAYDRLGTSLAPPPDVAVRVEREVGGRRRRRRTALAGAAVLALAAAGGTAVVLGSGDAPDGTVVATDPTTPPAPPPAFVATRTDGTTIEFAAADLEVTCRKGVVTMTSPQEFDASQDHLTTPFFYAEAIPEEATGRTFTLPFDGDENTGSDGREVIVFVADSGPDANEVSSAEGGAAGTVTVTKAACDPEPVLELTVDATLGSEVQQGTYTVKGAFPTAPAAP